MNGDHSDRRKGCGWGAQVRWARCSGTADWYEKGERWAGQGQGRLSGQLIVMLLPLPPPRGHLGHSISTNFTFF